MKNLKNKTNKLFSFVLVAFMVVSTLFVCGTEAKADTGTIYEPYYDAVEDRIVGAPEVGTVLTADDVIKAGDNLAENVDVVVKVHLLKEEITENARYYSLYILDKGEQKPVSEMKTALDAGETEFTVAKVETSRLGEKTSIEISMYANEGPEKVEDIVIEFDWSKFDVEIGGLLDNKNFKEGFIKNDKFTAKVGFDLGEIVVISPDGTEESFWGNDDVIINETDSYKVYAVLSLKDGYYVEVADEVVVNDETVKEGTAAPYTGQSHYWTTYIVVPIEFGTGAEMVERVKNAKEAIVPPTTGEEDKELEIPPVVEEDINNSSTENKSETAGNENTTVDTAPKTGDTINVVLYVMFFVCVAGILLVLRKMNRI